MKKFVLVPDSFKGTMSSAEVCAVMTEAIRGVFPAAVYQICSLHGRLVTATARIGAPGHGIGHRPSHLGRLAEGGCPIIQIDHRVTSSQSPLFISR